MPKQWTLQALLANTTQQGDCLLWNGGKSKPGYGQVRVGSRIVGVHRLVVELKRGAIPKGMVILHACDNRACINPAHLQGNSQKANVHDMWDKGRAHNQCVTLEQAAEIRRRYKPHDKANGARPLGREFGVSHRAIGQIVHGKSYGRGERDPE